MPLYFLQRAMRLGVRNVRILVRGMGTGRLVCTQIALCSSAIVHPHKLGTYSAN